MFKKLNFSLLKVNNQDIERIKSNFESEIQSPWDPATQVDINALKENVAEVLAKFEKLKQDPKKPKRHLNIAMSIFLPLVLIYTYFFIKNDLYTEEGLFTIFFLLLLPVFYVYGYYQNLSKDILKIQIAEEKDYFYNPKQDITKWTYLKAKFPEIFGKGTDSQYVEDEFWGNVNKNNKNYEFYSGLFSYTVTSGSGKHRRSITYNKHFFAIKLNQSLNSRFFLYPENVLSKIVNFFSKKEINTESNEFNKTFAFSYNGKKDERAQDIVKTLSPAVQTKLLDLNKQKKGMEILFSDGCVFFMFNNFLFKKMKTNLFKSCEISQEDKDFLSNQLKLLIDLSTEIVKYLD